MVSISSSFVDGLAKSTIRSISPRPKLLTCRPDCQPSPSVIRQRLDHGRGRHTRQSEAQGLQTPQLNPGQRVRAQSRCDVTRLGRVPDMRKNQFPSASSPPGTPATSDEPGHPAPDISPHTVRTRRRQNKRRAAAMVNSAAGQMPMVNSQPTIALTRDPPICSHFCLS